MPDKPNNPFQFWQELKRRKVIRVIPVYAAASFVLLELVDIITEPFGLPDSTLKFVFVLLCVGFIIAVILSWVYDVTPEGVQKTKPISKVTEQQKEVPTKTIGWKIATIVSVVIIVGLIIFHTVGERKQAGERLELEKSIAVLPFDNMSIDEEYSHMGDAITDEIILELQKIKEFDRVLSRSSTMQYKDNRPTIPEIAEKLGVNYIIEGSIQRHKEDVSIRVQVIRAKNEDHVWAKKYDGKWEDIFSIQDEIAFKVADELKTVLSPEEMERIEKKPTENPEAYNLYLKGRYFWNYRTEETLLKAIEFFNQAVKQDSNYALAYVGLADSYIMLPWYAPPSSAAYLKAEQAALKALEIDYNLAEAHATMGFIYYSEWNFTAAEKDFLKAIELDPEYASGHHWYAMLLKDKGLFEQAIDEILKARNLDPLSLVINRNTGVIYISARQYDKAIDALNKVIEIDPEFSGVQHHLARAYLNKGMYENALSAIQNSGSKVWTGIIYAHMGQLDKANQLLDELVLLSKTEYISPFYLAILHFSLSSEEQGFNCLEKAFRIHDLDLTEIRGYPELDEFSSKPRFIDLLNKMGLEE